MSQDGYGGEGAKKRTLQVGGGGDRAKHGQLSHAACTEYIKV